jgi:mRNA interferase YafQ
MYEIILTTSFKRDLKRAGKRNFNDLVLIEEIVGVLMEKGIDGIPISMKPHRLIGLYKDNWECHIKPDLLIIWIQIESPKIIKLVRIGSHSDLFK